MDGRDAPFGRSHTLRCRDGWFGAWRCVPAAVGPSFLNVFVGVYLFLTYLSIIDLAGDGKGRDQVRHGTHGISHDILFRIPHTEAKNQFSSRHGCEIICLLQGGLPLKIRHAALVLLAACLPKRTLIWSAAGRPGQGGDYIIIGAFGGRAQSPSNTLEKESSV